MNPYLTHIDYPINIDKIKALARQRTQDIVSKDYASIPDQHGFNRITIKNNWEAYAQKIYYDFFDEFFRDNRHQQKRQRNNRQRPKEASQGSGFIISKRVQSIQRTERQK